MDTKNIKGIKKQKLVSIYEYPVENCDGENIFGAKKYHNPDWTMVVYFISRKALKEDYIDDELGYSGIYFLHGNIDGERKVYVGKAGKRVNGQSILKRLREHDTSKTEWYRDVWDTAIVLTTLNDSWQPTEISMLENKFYHAFNKDNLLNGQVPVSGASDSAVDYEEKVRQGKSFLNYLGVNLFNSEIKEGVIEEITGTYKATDINKEVENIQKNKKAIPEITTPLVTVNKMLDMLPDDVWNPETKFLDPACKGGEYLDAIFNRLMESPSLKKEFGDKVKRAFHILNNQLYGITLSDESLRRVNLRLYGTISANSNIKKIDNYINTIKGIGIKKLINENFKIITEKGEEVPVHFDVIIGNPPYNDERTGGGNKNQQRSRSIYPDFVKMAYDLGAKYNSFIIPCRWFTEVAPEYSDIRGILLSNRTQVLYDFPNSSDVFSGVSIVGGVCYYLYNKDYKGECEIHSDNDTFYYKLVPNIPFIRDKIVRNIVDKVKIKSDSFLSETVSNCSPFGFKRNERGTLKKSEINNIKLIASSRDDLFGETYVSMDMITKNRELVPLYKVYAGYTQALTDGVISSLGVLKPYEICTLTYVTIASFEKQTDAENCMKYMRTRFARVLLKSLTTTLGTLQKNYANIPVQDFTPNSDIDWSQSITNIDQQLYKKYNLTPEEIHYIESTIKSMDTYTM